MANSLTPDSVPSLATLSSASPDDPGHVARALFQTPEKDYVEEASEYSRANEDETDSLFGSEISVASEGDDTVVEMVEMERSGRAKTNEPILMPTSSQNLAKESDQAAPKSLPIPATCHSALSMSPQDLAGMFNIFGLTPKQKPVDSPDMLSPSSIAADSGTETETDAVTEVTSNVDHSVISWDRRIDSLERECATLKDIIKADSVRILHLRTELASLRGTGPAVDSPTQKQVEALKQEKDALVERESLHLETIKSLKHELNEMVKAKHTSLAIPKELEQLRLENALLASQIVENETALRTLETENTELKEELAKQQTAAPTANINRPEAENDGGGASRDALQAKVASLFAKIAEIESEQERRDKAMADDTRQTHEELARIQTLILEPEHHSPEKQAVESEPEVQKVFEANEVEVTIDGEIITNSSFLETEPTASTSQKQQPDASGECGGAFCDCLPSASLVDEEE